MKIKTLEEIHGTLERAVVDSKKSFRLAQQKLKPYWETMEDSEVLKTQEHKEYIRAYDEACKAINALKEFEAQEW